MVVLAYLLAVAVLIGSLGARVHMGRLARRGVSDSDELFHRVYTRIIRTNGHRLPDRFPQFVGPGRNTYPAGYHWALSFVADRGVDVIARYGALVCDLLLGGAVSVLLATTGDLPVAAVIAVLGLYLAAPALTLVNVGPRSFHLSPRAPSQLLYGAIAVGIMATGGDVSWGLGAAIALVLALLLLSSKFAVQVVLFALPVLAVAGEPIIVLACFAAGCLLATIISRGFFIRQVAAQGKHLRWYTKRELGRVRRASGAELARAIRGRDIRAATRIITLQNPVTSGLVRHLHLVAAALWLLVAWPALEPTASVALAFTLAGILGWILTSVGVMRVLGEPERYLEFALPASWFLFWSLPHGGALVLALVLAVAYELAWYAFNVKVMSAWVGARDAQRRGRDAALAVLAEQGPVTALFLDIKDAYVVHGIPGVQAVMWSGQPSPDGEVAEFMEWFLWRYPLVNPRNLDEIIARYGVNVLVANREAVETVGHAVGRGYRLAQFPRIYENSEYVLLSAGKPANGAQPGDGGERRSIVSR